MCATLPCGPQLTSFLPACYLAICFAFSRNIFLLPFILSYMSISAQLLPAQCPSMDQLIEFYFELDIKYADTMLLLRTYGSKGIEEEKYCEHRCSAARAHRCDAPPLFFLQVRKQNIRSSHNPVEIHIHSSLKRICHAREPIKKTNGMVKVVIWTFKVC